MGASSGRQIPEGLPAQGCRVMQLLNPQLQGKLQPFTDYIIDPSPQQLRRCSGQVAVTVFSILDYSSRRELLPISENSFGARIKVARVTDCALRVTKTFPGSPCERVGIAVDEYIVGLLEADFYNLKTFAHALHELIAKKKDVLTLAVCSQAGAVRLVAVAVGVLDEWKTHNHGILGCELAEGWMHRFKPRQKRGDLGQEGQVKIEEKVVEEAREEGMVGLSELQREGEGEGSEQSEELQRKLGVGVGECVQVNFKGLLKNQYLQDASTICRCKIYDKSCERCWVQREGGYHFFNKKTNRIVSIPGGMMLRLTE